MTSYVVPGKPIPQGSMSAFRGRIVHSNAKELKAWRSLVRDSYPGPLLDGPVIVNLVFALRKPRTVNRQYPHVKPDIDRLARAILDALTTVAFADDSQVITLTAEKTYGQEGVSISVQQA